MSDGGEERAVRTPAVSPGPQPPPVRVRRARIEEAEQLATVIREAFLTEAEVYGDIPPMHERAADIEATFLAGDVVLAAEVDGELVGTVRGESLPDGSLEVRRLAVLRQFRRLGVARALLIALEGTYPDVERFELFTGGLNHAALGLYEDLGYARTGSREIAPGVELVTLEKRAR